MTGPFGISDRTAPCNICGAPTLHAMPAYDGMRRVTSDCKPWRPGGVLCRCLACGAVQKLVDGRWLAETREIYSDYSVYHQGAGAEQAVFYQDSGCSSSRSTGLIKRMAADIDIAPTGRLLDIGTGNGAFLKAFSSSYPQWSLVGTELDDRYRAAVESVRGVENFYTCSPSQVPGKFNVITLIHLLEHVPHPKDFLLSLYAKLEPDGMLLIETPNYLDNPFDLLIADHCTHFAANTIAALLRRTCYEPMVVATDWIPKELTVVATRSVLGSAKVARRQGNDAETGANAALRWLEAVLLDAGALASTGDIGIFGTSIAATWLFTNLEASVKFFVDEDPNRYGRSYIGRPVLHPTQVPASARVFLALPTEIALRVMDRMRHQNWPVDGYVIPRPLE